MKGAALYFGLLAGVILLFTLLPGIDLATSRLFYAPGHGFRLQDWEPLRRFEDTIPWITRCVAAFVLLAGAWLGLTGRPLGRFDLKALVFLVLATALGPGLLANAILKDHWGRARPSQVEAFGGDREFTPAPLIADQCTRNCSFVSGHAALGFSLVSFAFLLPCGRWRRSAQAAAIAFGILVGLGRVAEGKHFLSDIVFAGLLVYGTSWTLFRLIVQQNMLASPRAFTIYRAVISGGGRLRAFTMGWWSTPMARLGFCAGSFALLEGLSMAYVDRPLAAYFHDQDPALRALFDLIGRLGLTYPYLLLFGLAFAALYWGENAPQLRPWAAAMRRAAAVPAFIFAALALSGLLVDLLKLVCGRTRPKLLFASDAYGFTGVALHPDHWSFPSGHAATVAALMTALYCLWPRHLLFYLAVGALVAFCRVVTGAHYLSDVLMGAAIGALVTRGLGGMLAAGRIGRMRLPFRLHSPGRFAP
ncbi:MAG: phosphatase PAP2 family protein [Alphaproteobacteria bacterium]|nr:phosphatase PAP2 family protein [Alphaproteobacteria bacterium]